MCWDNHFFKWLLHHPSSAPPISELLWNRVRGGKARPRPRRAPGKRSGKWSYPVGCLRLSYLCSPSCIDQGVVLSCLVFCLYPLSELFIGGFSVFSLLPVKLRPSLSFIHLFVRVCTPTLICSSIICCFLSLSLSLYFSTLGKTNHMLVSPLVRFHLDEVSDFYSYLFFFTYTKATASAWVGCFLFPWGLPTLVLVFGCGLSLFLCRSFCFFSHSFTFCFAFLQRMSWIDKRRGPPDNHGLLFLNDEWGSDVLQMDVSTPPSPPLRSTEPENLGQKGNGGVHFWSIDMRLEMQPAVGLFLLERKWGISHCSAFFCLGMFCLLRFVWWNCLKGVFRKHNLGTHF